MIKLDHVKKKYENGVDALNDINLHIAPGEFVFIVGDSGSGKSTLIKLLLKEIEPSAGSILVNGQNVRKLKRRHIAEYRRNIGVVFQDFRLLPDLSVYDNVAFAQRVIEASKRSIQKKVPMMLALVGLAGNYKAKPNQLSGGEQQRVAIARALINDPKIILADEPTGNLDKRNTWEIMNLLQSINARGTTVIVVTHNTEVVERMRKRTIQISEGMIVNDTPAAPESEIASL